MLFSTKVYYTVLIVQCICANIPVIVTNETSHREKRSYVIFPMGGQFKIVTGLAVPIKLGLKQSMAFGLNIQFQYATVTNLSQISEYPPIVSRSRGKREHSTNDRAAAYLGLELIMERYKINGRACLLRTICENSMQSLHHESNGLYGHLLHIFLTPDYGDNDVDSDLDPAYVEAHMAGKYGVYCDSLYPDCPYRHGSILDMISFLDHS